MKCVFLFICIFVNMYILSNSCLLSGKLFLSSKILYIFNIFHIVFNNYLYQKRHFSTFSTTFSTAFLTIQKCKVKYHYKKAAIKYTFFVYLIAALNVYHSLFVYERIILVIILSLKKPFPFPPFLWS